MKRFSKERRNRCLTFEPRKGIIDIVNRLTYSNERFFLIEIAKKTLNNAKQKS